MYKDTGDNFVMDSNGKLTLQTDSTPRIVMTNAGCVGIGTNAVASGCGAELDIFSAGASTGLILRSGNSSAASATVIGEGYRGNGDSEQVFQVVGRNRNAGIDLGIFEVASESLHCLGALELKTFDGSSMTTKMKITSGGNVGVGTATPAGKFHVEGSCAVFNPVSANAGKLEIVQGSTHADSIRLNATGTTNMYLEYRGYNGHVFVVDSTEAMRILHDGSSARVGVGTTLPCAKLSVYGSAYIGKGQGVNEIASLCLSSTTTAGYGGIINGLRNEQLEWRIGHSNAILSTGACADLRLQSIGSIIFGTCNIGSTAQEAMRIMVGNGNVGIGTQSPSEKLEVFGGKIENKRTGGGYIHLVRNDGTGTANESLGIIDFISIFSR